LTEPGSQPSWQALTFYSLVGFGMAAVCFLNMDPRAGITAEAALLEASGRLAWVQEHKYGTRFGLVGVSERFNYPSKAEGMKEVRDALKHAGMRVVSVRYESDTHGPIYSDERFHDVWELVVGRHTVRSYAETVEGWESDNRLIPWLGSAMALCGLGLAYAAWRARRTARGASPLP
jgi:hypothetical protein